jgi:recombination protein RecA
VVDGKGDATLKIENVEALVKNINEKLKRDAITMASNPKFKMNKITSGSYAIDFITGGGFPRGRAIELFGDFATGKTYIALRTVAEAQKRKELCAYLDAERSLDVAWAKSLGVNLKKLIISSDWEYGEDLIDMMEALLRLGDVKVIVLDSVAALLPQQEGEKTATQMTVGRGGALMSKAMRKLTAANNGTVLLFVNQTREKIGQMFGDNTHATGGRALGYYASQRVKLKLGAKIKDGTNIIGQEINALVQKDKTQPPYKQIKFVFDLQSGRIRKEDELFAVGVATGIIEQVANRWVYDDDKYTRKALLEHFAISMVEDEVTERLGLCRIG